jgi:hypothetical protein
MSAPHPETIISEAILAIFVKQNIVSAKERKVSRKEVKYIAEPFLYLMLLSSGT